MALTQYMMQRFSGKWVMAYLAEDVEVEVARLTQARDTTRAAVRDAAAWIRAPGNISRVDPIDECARVIENLSRQFGAAEGALGPLPPWQPIATAPKDGGVMLMWDPTTGVVKGYWLSSIASSPCWWEVNGFAIYPTHWVPLPAGPLPSP